MAALFPDRDVLRGCPELLLDVVEWLMLELRLLLLLLAVVMLLTAMGSHRRGVDPLDGPLAAAAWRGAIGATLLRPLRDNSIEKLKA